MNRVFKYNLTRVATAGRVNPIGYQQVVTLYVPKNAQFLSVDFQDGTLVVWAEVNTESEGEERSLLRIPTGVGIPDKLGLRRFIGSASTQGYVTHVYEIVQAPQGVSLWQ